MAAHILSYFVRVNLGWGVFNLFPMLPLDGGAILAAALEGLIGPAGRRVAHGLSIALALGLAVLLVASRLVRRRRSLRPVRVCERPGAARVARSPDSGRRARSASATRRLTARETTSAAGGCCACTAATPAGSRSRRQSVAKAPPSAIRAWSAAESSGSPWKWMSSTVFSPLPASTLMWMWAGTVWPGYEAGRIVRNSYRPRSSVRIQPCSRGTPGRPSGV